MPSERLRWIISIWEKKCVAENKTVHFLLHEYSLWKHEIDGLDDDGEQHENTIERYANKD